MSTSVTSPRLQRLALSLIAAALAVIGFAACQPAPAPGPKLAEEIVVYSTSDEKMDAVFDAFTKETGVKVNLKYYYPANQQLKRAEILLPLSLEGQKLYDEIWERFEKAGQ